MGDLWTVVHEEEVTTTDTIRRQVGGQEPVTLGRGGQVAKVAKLPLGLMQDQVKPVDELAEQFPELKEALTEMAGGQLAASTLSNYTGAVARYRRFCEQQGYEITELTEKTIIHYAAVLTKEKATYSIISQVRPALKLLEQMNKGSVSAFTDRAERLLDGALRSAASRREPAKKAGEVDLTWLQRQVEETVWDKLDKGIRVDAYRLRLVFRLVMEYFTFCRLSDFQKLRAKHLELIDGGLQITFPSAKNDQLHNGQITILQANGSNMCPVRLAVIYCQQLGLVMGREGKDERFLSCRIRKSAGVWTADPGAPVSLSKSREELKELLGKTDNGKKGITDKSFKMLGVTSMYKAGATPEEVGLHGRWRTAETSLRYKHNSVDYKMEVSAKIPF